VYTHIHDNFCLPDRQTPDAHLIPFDGNIDYRYVADMLDGVNFDGTLTLEVAGDSPHYADLNLEQFCARAAAAARRLATLRADRG
jgi:sugar phosphate isomerase/epimerase